MTSDNGLSPAYHRAIILTNAGLWSDMQYRIQGWGEYQIYEYKYKYKYLQYVWVRVRVLDYYMSTSQSPSTGWRVWVQVRVPVYDLHSIFLAANLALAGFPLTNALGESMPSLH